MLGRSSLFAVRHILMKRLRRTDWLLLLLVFVPTITELMETGRFPERPRDMISDVVLTVIVGLLALFFIRNHQKMRYLSEIDAVTGIRNRRSFEKDISTAVMRSHRLGSRLTLAVIDVDDFKSINDRYGHDTGDRVLRDIGTLINTSVRHGIDTCYRTGGDEFAVLLPALGTEGTEGIERRIKTLKDRGGGLLRQYHSALSIGIAVLKDTDSPDDLFRRADAQMYGEKCVNRSRSGHSG
jgi:diguanylate cyclase (GGDEF)-like protein